MTPLISIIMATYNEPVPWLKESILSIQQQSFKKFEFIIVNDNPSNKEIPPILKKIAKKDLRIKLVFNEQNKGLPFSLNKAIDLSKGEFIARMDADDIADPKRIEKEYISLKENKNIDMVCSNRVIINSKGEIIRENNQKTEDFDNLKNTIFSKMPISHPTIMIRSAILKNNKYNETYLNTQDFELWLRLLKKGLTVKLIEEPLLKYRIVNFALEKKIKKFKTHIKYTNKAIFSQGFKLSLWSSLILLIKNYIFYLILLSPKKLVKTASFIKTKVN